MSGKKQISSKLTTSWEAVADDYHKIVKSSGHFYHKEVILPRLLPLLSLLSTSSVLDMGCGQGVLERAIPKSCGYVGLDISPTLLAIAKKLSKSRNHKFFCQDLTQDFCVPLTQTFSHAVAILSLQNMQAPDIAIKHAHSLLEESGKFFLVLNHPCFRIPRMSSWHYDENRKLISRCVDRYLSPQVIPITAHPGKQKSERSLTFHFPLSYWVQQLSQHGFLIESMEEWISPKKSVGKRAKAENVCREEFPLFLFISCVRVHKNI